MRTRIRSIIQELLSDKKQLSYNDILRKQKIGDPYMINEFGNKTSKFIEDDIHIEKLRKLNGFNNHKDDEIEQTVSNFDELGLDEDYFISKGLMRKIIHGIELNPIVVDN
jgi:hypothetical protein